MASPARRQTVGPGAWLHAASAPPVGRAHRMVRRAQDGRVAALVEAGCGAGVASHLLLADPRDAGWQDVAVFEARIEAMEWQGAELLLGFAGGECVRVFSVFPGMRLRDAGGAGGLRWLRLSTRRSRR